jgi:glycosyltransferase involved in cell wall biosynthesis
MTILFLNDTMGAGGKERRLLELIKMLVTDHKIILVSLSEEVGYDYIKSLPIEFITIKRAGKLDLKPFSVISKIIKKHNPDIIHSWGSLSGLYLIPSAIRRRERFINGSIADAPKKMSAFNNYYLRVKLTYPFSRLIISNSKAGIKSYDAPKSKSLCIYNGMDFNRFKNLKDPGLLRCEIFKDNSTDIFVVGMVANFTERKDQKTLVTSAIKLLQKNSQLRFVFVGAGSMVEVMEIVPAELKNKIFFLGKRSDVESIVQLFDIGVMLTNSDVHGEGISNSIIEYMALQKPVIATRGGGTDELIIDNENGFLIDSGADDQLTEKIELLLSNRELAAKIAKKGYDLVFKEFNIEVMAAKYLEVYRKMTVRK